MMNKSSKIDPTWEHCEKSKKNTVKNEVQKSMCKVMPKLPAQSLGPPRGGDGGDPRYFIILVAKEEVRSPKRAIFHYTCYKRGGEDSENVNIS